MKMVRVNYKEPPSEEVKTTYFEDHGFYSDWRYRDALKFWNPDAVFVDMERGVEPMDDGHHCS